VRHSATARKSISSKNWKGVKIWRNTDNTVQIKWQLQTKLVNCPAVENKTWRVWTKWELCIKQRLKEWNLSASEIQSLLKMSLFLQISSSSWGTGLVNLWGMGHQEWSDERFIITNMPSYVLSHIPLRNLLWHKSTSFLWILSRNNSNYVAAVFYCPVPILCLE
jgi:hypothetical protein